MSDYDQSQDLATRADTALAAGDIATASEDAEKPRLQRRRIGARSGRAEALDALSVGDDEGGIDAIRRGPAHQADRGQRLSHAAQPPPLSRRALSC